MPSKIEWTDETWNPIRGCTRVSEGCRNCYAERQAIRMANRGGPYEGLVVISNGHPKWTGELRFVESKLLEPLRWKKPRMIFVNSMSDLFHPAVGRLDLAKIIAVMLIADWHVFQVLTKRPERMRDCLSDENFRQEITDATAVMLSDGRITKVQANDVIEAVYAWPPPHIWWGVSVEDQKTADERILLLLETLAAVRWVSYEPALGPVLFDNGETSWLSCRFNDDYRESNDGYCCDAFAERGVHFRGVDWVVCGGESGPGARPMYPDWARSLRDQCAAAGVPFFFKQWGEFLPPVQDGNPDTPGGQDLNLTDDPIRIGKKAAGRLLDGVEHNEYPEVAK